MDQWRKFASISIWVLVAAGAYAVEIPAGAELHVRLKSKLSTASSKAKDPVEAVLLQPVAVGGNFVIPAGAELKGQVQDVQPTTRPDQRASLSLDFSEIALGSLKTKLAAQVAEVEDARESVDTTGKIVGILASESISARMDQGIGKVAQKYGGLADILQTVKTTVLKASEGDITYEPGVEMTLKLTKALEVKEPTSDSGPKLQDIADEAGLVALVLRQPFRTMAQQPSKPSDITNLMYIGTQEQLEKAFAAAGWAQAAALSGQSKLETFRAIAEMRGYKEAPVSILLLDGQKPDLVFQKQNNTFAQRHHLRIWRRPDNFQGQPVWVCAATHDIGIDFSQENRTFIHKIDPQIDHERAKVTSDLLFTGMVRSLAAVDRPEVPTSSQNATGDRLETDGKMAVLILQ